MGDFLPGYVTTFCNPKFVSIPSKIIVLGKENGKIYATFNDKEKLFQRANARKGRMEMMCYYRDIEFTPDEQELLWNRNFILMDESQRQRVQDSMQGSFRMVSVRRSW